MVVVGRLLLDGLQGGAGDVRVDLCDIAHSLGAALPEDHSGVGTDILWVLDEAEPASCLVSCPQVVLVHRHNGRRLPGAPTVNCRELRVIL